MLVAVVFEYRLLVRIFLLLHIGMNELLAVGLCCFQWLGLDLNVQSLLNKMRRRRFLHDFHLDYQLDVECLALRVDSKSFWTNPYFLAGIEIMIEGLHKIRRTPVPPLL